MVDKASYEKEVIGFRVALYVQAISTSQPKVNKHSAGSHINVHVLFESSLHVVIKIIYAIVKVTVNIES